MQKVFYEKEGLAFECVRCSACCRFDPGYVFLSLQDLARLSKRMNFTKDLFIQKFCRIVTVGEKKRLSLREKKNYDCIFWGEEGCSVYQDRPFQCRSYPFWKPFLVSRDAWDKEARSCPGMNKGKIHSVKVIEDWLEKSDNEEYSLEAIL